MVATPNTWGVVVLLVVVFAACILWATGRTIGGRHDSEEEDIQAVGKSS